MTARPAKGPRPTIDQLRELEARFDARYDAIRGRLGRIDERFARIEERLGALEAQACPDTGTVARIVAAVTAEMLSRTSTGTRSLLQQNAIVQSNGGRIESRPRRWGFLPRAKG